MESVLDRELQMYEQQRDALLISSEGMFALIHGDAVVGVYEAKQDAISEGYRRFGNVPFLVKQIVQVETPLYFTSRILAI